MTAREGAGPLAGRRAVVTGASRGIGAAVARALAHAGAAVALVARGAAALDAVAAELGPGAVAIPADVTDPEAVRRLVAALRERWPEAPDILVNNAGLFDPKPLEQITTGEFEAALRVNLLAPFLLVRALLPAMRARGRGHVVTIGSVADHTAFTGNGAYAASKFGVRGLHEVLRLELRGTGVRATLISPGPTDTPLWDALHVAGTGRFPPREGMMPAAAVADAVRFALVQPAAVNVDELRLTPA